jgi:hypothetical protein
MYHYDPKTALDELREDALLPHPVRLRDMILRTRLDPVTALDLNRDFQEYLARFGEIQKIGLDILEKLAAGKPKSPA